MSLRAKSAEPSLESLQNVLTFEDLVGQVVTDVNPAFKLLAKWKFEGLDNVEVTTKRGIWAMLSVLTASLKSSIGTNTASIRGEGSVNDITYNASTSIPTFQTTSINFIGGTERNTGAIFASEVGQANHFVRLIVDTGSAGQSATYKNLKLTVLMIMPLGVTVKRIFP